MSSVRSAVVNRRNLLAPVRTSAALPYSVSNAAAQARGQVLRHRNDGSAKEAMLEFVLATTDQSSKDFPAEDHIATFNQDGTMWAEHPACTEAILALERVHVLAPQRSEWKDREPFQAALSNNVAAIAKMARIRSGTTSNLISEYAATKASTGLVEGLNRASRPVTTTQ